MAEKQTLPAGKSVRFRRYRREMRPASSTILPLWSTKLGPWTGGLYRPAHQDGRADAWRRAGCRAGPGDLLLRQAAEIGWYPQGREIRAEGRRTIC